MWGMIRDLWQRHKDRQCAKGNHYRVYGPEYEEEIKPGMGYDTPKKLYMIGRSLRYVPVRCSNCSFTDRFEVWGE